MLPHWKRACGCQIFRRFFYFSTMVKARKYTFELKIYIQNLGLAHIRTCTVIRTFLVIRTCWHHPDLFPLSEPVPSSGPVPVIQTCLLIRTCPIIRTCSRHPDLFPSSGPVPVIRTCIDICCPIIRTCPNSRTCSRHPGLSHHPDLSPSSGPVP